MHKRSIFSSRYDKLKQTSNEIWMEAFRKSKIFPKITQTKARNIISAVKKSENQVVCDIKVREKKLLASNEWYDSSKISISDRYLLEQQLNLDLLEKQKREMISLNCPSIVEESDIKEEIKEHDSEDHEELKIIFNTISDIEIAIPDPVTVLENVMKIEALDEVAEELAVQSYVNFEQELNVSLPIMANYSRYKKYTCFYCDKRFTRPWILNNHLNLHSGVKPFICPEGSCMRAFSDPSNLRVHQRAKGHHNWKYICTQCSMAFHSEEILNRHTVHACRRYLAKIKRV